MSEPWGAPLSPREQEVAALAVEGLSNDRIAAELGLGLSTVRGYLTGVYRKLGVNSRTKLAVRLTQGVDGGESVRARLIAQAADAVIAAVMLPSEPRAWTPRLLYTTLSHCRTGPDDDVTGVVEALIRHYQMGSDYSIRLACLSLEARGLIWRWRGRVLIRSEWSYDEACSSLPASPSEGLVSFNATLKVVWGDHGAV